MNCKCIHELFEEQVERTPEEVAVVFEDRRLTYRELNERANRLARHLHGLGVGPDTLVAMCMERSLEMVAGLLGILKAGGAYVPLDPGYPIERLKFMLRDSAAVLLLTQQHLRDKLWVGSPKVRLLCLDADWEAIARSSAENPESGAGPENLAYVIYTSGSTGQPKGVEIRHRSLANLLCSIARKPGFTHGDKLLAVTTISFDIAALELFLPVIAGGQVAVAPASELRDGFALRRRLELSGATVMQATPATWAMLIEAGWSGDRDLRALCGGEAVATGLADGLLMRVKEVWNVYGPTETTIWSSIERLQTGDPITIGRPIANTKFYVVDKQGQPVPIGVPGELHIGGVGLARGYHNRPELTAEKFIPDPFRSEAGARLYKSGDLARYLPNGAIEYLGRLDHQVKIRGFRIELGEIESVLATHSAVREAAVLAREDAPGEKRLVAYLTVKEGVSPKDSELRELLRAKLPEYMVPSAFVVLDRFPLTPNGKVDRKALPQPDMESSNAAEFAPPETETQKALAAIWGETLGVEQIGLHDNFFDLGGHSLMATRVVSRAALTFGVRVQLQALFEHPTLAILSAQIDNLRSNGRCSRPLQVIPRSGNLPLSFAQQRLWVLDQFEPNSATYNMPIALRLGGALDAAVLQLCLSEIVLRHEALRSCFKTVDGEPIQVIQPAASFEILLVDLIELSEPEREETAVRLCAAEARRPFDLTRDVLLRAKLFRLDEADHILLLTMHHIASDGWSLGVLSHELGALYGAFVEGKPSPLPELPVQYADYALWQREWLQGEALEKQLDYWKKQLESAPAVLELPTDRPRPAIQSYRGALISGELPKPLSAALKGLSRAEGATLFMTLLAAFQTLLYRYSGGDQIVVGSPIAGRQRPELERLIGFFVNTLVMRGDLSGDPSFRTLLARTRQAAIGAYAHQDLPFEKLVEELHPTRSVSHAPLFQVMFILQNVPQSDLVLPRLEVARIPVDLGVSKFDLSLIVREREGALSILVEYSTDLFEADTIRRMLGHYQTLLEGIVANPDGQLSELPLLTGAERRQLLVEWNQTETPYPKDRCVHELFEQQVERTPEAVAAVFEDTQLTYRQLNERANQLARYLQKLGVGPDTLVAICVERSLEMVVGLLGILKAGGAYVPLDPTYPTERLAFMLQDSAPVAILSHGRARTTLAGVLAGLPEPPHILDLGCHAPTRVDRPTANIDPAKVGLTPRHLAYVIYTSGSTGRPKGVAMTSRALVNLLTWQATDSPLTPGARALQFASVGFDVAFQEILSTLTEGGTLVLTSEDNHLNPEALLSLIRLQGVNRAFLPPAMVEVLADASAGEIPPSLEDIFIAGDALRLTPAIHAMSVGSPLLRLHNHYGPTESHVAVGDNLSVDSADWPVEPPIGRPIANTRIYLLDGRREPVPIGVSGEIYIGGAGVARGYLNRPELTAERFISSPFVEGDRLYRTGDLGRYLANGKIEFLGRNDFQVKIRGFRIELGEIEAQLAQHPTVRAALVLAREDEPGEKRLIAYLTMKKEEAPTHSELRGLLRAKLPDYMVPSAFVVLDRFPLTPNGKVDRKALPQPDMASADRARFVPPETETQKALANIWREVLGIERVGLSDNFFDLGGHSLMATRVVSRAALTFGVRVQLQALFEHPTLAILSAQIDNLRSNGQRHRTAASEPLASVEEGAL